jgi:hypothetical protein
MVADGDDFPQAALLFVRKPVSDYNHRQHKNWRCGKLPVSER